MASYTKKTAVGALYVSVNLAIASIVAYLTRILLARNLTTEAYGLFFAVFSFLTFLCFFSDFGISSAVVKYISEYIAKKDYSRIKASIAASIIISIASTALMCTVLMVLSKPLAEFYFKNSLAFAVLNLLVVYVLFNVMLNILKQIFRGLQRMFVFSIIEPLKNLLVFIFAWILFAAGFQLFSAPAAYVIGTLIILIAMAFAASKLIQLKKYKIANTKEEAKKLILFGMPMIMTTFGALVIGNTDTLLLTYMRTLPEVGIYNVVLPSALMFMFFAQVLSAVALPFASELWARKDSKKIREGLRMFYKYCYLLMLPCVLAVFMFAQFFLGLFFGSAYASGSLAFQILLIGVLFYIAANINNTIITGIGKPGEITKIILVAAAINIVVQLILIPPFGIAGAASATALSYFVVFLLSALKIHKYIKVKMPVSAWVAQAVLGLVFAGIVFYLKNILQTNIFFTIIISCAIGFAVYAAGALIFKLIDIREIKKYIKLVRA